MSKTRHFTVIMLDVTGLTHA